MTALVVAALLYAPTLGRGLVNYDDPWLVRDNWIVQSPSWASLRAIWFDFGIDTRATLGAEYLPVRDLSILADYAIWGSWFPGFHLTNLVIYLASIALWFGALTAFGIDRKIAGLAILIWAVHPSHAESVAWISERKGLLAMMFAGAAALGHARFRAGARTRWLVLATCAAIAAVWSKAPAAFIIASFAGLELVLPERRRSMRRSLVALAVIAVAAIAAFIPILYVATDLAVVANDSTGAGRAPAAALGLLGFYVRLAVLTVPSAVSYPIATDGPTTIDIVIGVAAIALLIAALVPWRRPQIPGALRAASLIWLFGWFPVSRLLLPVKAVVVADRYLLFPSLGFALAIAVGICALARPLTRNALAAVIVLAAGMRTFDAQSSWRDDVSLWEQAVQSSPRDSKAWSSYVEALSARGDKESALAAAERASELAPSPELQQAEALLVLPSDRARGVALMRRAAEGGSARAMTNLAVLWLEEGRTAEALAWARRSAQTLPRYAQGHRIHGKAALAAGIHAEALTAFERAYEVEPLNATNRFNVALALIALHRPAEARAHLEACLADPRLATRAKQQLEALPR